MSIAALQLGANVEIPNEDVIAAGGFLLPTGLYPMVVENAYLDKTATGAWMMHVHLKRKTGGNQVYRFKNCIVSGDAKGNKPTYISKQGKELPLPGYSQMNQITQICADLKLGQITPEKKLVKIWDFDASAEVAREVDVVTEIVGQEILVGLIEKHENKRGLNEKTGKWEPTNDRNELNEIDKVFYPDGFSVTEKEAEADTPVFVETWKKAHPDGVAVNKFKPVAGAPAASAGSSAPASTAAAAPDDLFND
jgi:hypothetical protein